MRNIHWGLQEQTPQKVSSMTLVSHAWCFIVVEMGKMESRGKDWLKQMESKQAKRCLSRNEDKNPSALQTALHSPWHPEKLPKQTGNQHCNSLCLGDRDLYLMPNGGFFQPLPQWILASFFPYQPRISPQTVSYFLHSRKDTHPPWIPSPSVISWVTMWGVS